MSCARTYTVHHHKPRVINGDNNSHLSRQVNARTSVHDNQQNGRQACKRTATCTRLIFAAFWPALRAQRTEVVRQEFMLRVPHARATIILSTSPALTFDVVVTSNTSVQRYQRIRLFVEPCGAYPAESCSPYISAQCRGQCGGVVEGGVGCGVVGLSTLWRYGTCKEVRRHARRGSAV